MQFAPDYCVTFFNMVVLKLADHRMKSFSPQVQRKFFYKFYKEQVNADNTVLTKLDSILKLFQEKQTDNLDEHQETLEKLEKLTKRYKNSLFEYIEKFDFSSIEQDSLNNNELIVVKENDESGQLEHYQTKLLFKLIKNKINAMLVGPAGSGKSKAAEIVASRLNLPFYCQSVCAQTSKSELLGYNDANGNYVKTHFRQAFEFGGLFLLDEIDAGNPNVLSVLNSALANELCAFPDAMVKKNENFVCIAAANTFGNGADRQYVGRNQLDAATLDRFGMINWNYDESLEFKISHNEKWTKYVQRVRKFCSEQSMRVVISPRASIYGGNLVNDGVDYKIVADLFLLKGMSEVQKSNVLKHCPFPIS
jgi:cobaltochelatase CobS